MENVPKPKRTLDPKLNPFSREFDIGLWYEQGHFDSPGICACATCLEDIVHPWEQYRKNLIAASRAKKNTDVNRDTDAG
jgi:hypothetical protein